MLRDFVCGIVYLCIFGLHLIALSSMVVKSFGYWSVIMNDVRVSVKRSLFHKIWY